MLTSSFLSGLKHPGNNFFCSVHSKHGDYSIFGWVEPWQEVESANLSI